MFLVSVCQCRVKSSHFYAVNFGITLSSIQQFDRENVILKNRLDTDGIIFGYKDCCTVLYYIPMTE